MLADVTFSSFFYQAPLCFQEITRNDCSVASDDLIFGCFHRWELQQNELTRATCLLIKN